MRLTILSIVNYVSYTVNHGPLHHPHRRRSTLIIPACNHQQGPIRQVAIPIPNTNIRAMRSITDINKILEVKWKEKKRSRRCRPPRVRCLISSGTADAPAASKVYFSPCVEDKHWEERRRYQQLSCWWFSLIAIISLRTAMNEQCCLSARERNDNDMSFSYRCSLVSSNPSVVVSFHIVGDILFSHSFGKNLLVIVNRKSIRRIFFSSFSQISPMLATIANPWHVIVWMRMTRRFKNG